MTFTKPQVCNSLRLVLKFERATDKVREISSAFSGLGETNNSACTWATVRLIPQRVPISPQCRMYFLVSDVSFISVMTEITELNAGCQVDLAIATSMTRAVA